MRVLAFSFEDQPVESAIAQSRQAFALARLALQKSQEPAAVIGAVGLAPGETFVLGALQHAGRVVPGAFDAGAKVLRRTTSGTGFRVDGGMLFTIAFSSADAAFADVTARTVLNRCVRPFLSGLSRAGLDATYLGREWIAYRRQALAVLGLDVSPSGSVVIEAWLNGRGSFAIPRELASPLEASCDRYRGKPTVSLEAIDIPRATLARRFIEGAADRLAGVVRTIDEVPDFERVDALVTAAESPLPSGAAIAVPLEIPIGFMDLARVPGGSSWVGGDMLAPTFALGFEPPAAVEQLPMEGARWENVRRAREMIGTT